MNHAFKKYDEDRLNRRRMKKSKRQTGESSGSEMESEYSQGTSSKTSSLDTESDAEPILGSQRRYDKQQKVKYKKAVSFSDILKTCDDLIEEYNDKKFIQIYDDY